MIKAIIPCFWFDNQAEEAASFYTSIFEKSEIRSIARYNDEGKEIHGKEEGTVMMVEFAINGQVFTALNGGPQFRFTEAVSLQIFCETQQEIDYYWNSLSNGGEEGQCGWLKDKFGLSWQIIPQQLSEWMSDPQKAGRVTEAFMQMKKMDIEKLRQA